MRFMCLTFYFEKKNYFLFFLYARKRAHSQATVSFLFIISEDSCFIDLIHSLFKLINYKQAEIKQVIYDVLLHIFTNLE